MGKLSVYQIEAWIDERYLTENEKEIGRNKSIIKAIGAREKMDIIKNILTQGVGIDEGTILETFFPAHCISRVIVTKKEET